MFKSRTFVTIFLFLLICVHLCTLLPIIEEANSISSGSISEVCGLRKLASSRHPKIVNGTAAFHGQFPWAVSIKARNKHHCGGALLNRQWVLTAAHCVVRRSPTMFTLKLGGHFKNADKENNSIEVNAKQLFAHEGFSFAHFANDIALIKLDRDVNYTDYISPVCLPSAKYYSIEEEPNATVIGWGRLQSAGASADKLMLLELPIINNEKCISWYKSRNRTLYLRASQFCAGFEEGGKDACQGDSGGPLMIENSDTNVTEVFGIVSAGIGCALPKLPGLYTKVAAYMPWISKIISRWSDVIPKNTTNAIIVTKKITNSTNLDIEPIVVINNHSKLNYTNKFTKNYTKKYTVGQSLAKPVVIQNSK